MGGTWHASKLSRIENANGKISVKEVETLLGHYSVTDPEVTEALQILARDAGKTGWWTSYGEAAPPALRDLISAQADAESIHQYHPSAIPGLLQTGAYAEAMTGATAFHLSPEEHAPIVEVRVARQSLLTRRSPVRYWVILDEHLLLQQFPSQPTLMRDQLRHLLDMADLPNVTIQIMPIGAGVHPGASGNFTINHFPDPWPTLIAIEGYMHMRFHDGAGLEPKVFGEAFNRIVATASPADQSREIIRKHMEGTS